jgi:hypothetical protein
LPARRFTRASVAVWLAFCTTAGTSAVAEEAARPAPSIYVSPVGYDAADGSPAAPLRTIAMASRRARPGTIVHVAPGIYEGGFKTDASGTREAPIAYMSADRWGARIVPPERSGIDVGWENDGAYVIIEGFDMDGSRPRADGVQESWRLGIYSTGSYSVIRDNHVHHIGLSSPCGDLGGAGVEGDSYYGASNIDLLDNDIHDIGSNRCKYIHGIYQTATGKVAGNVVYRTSGWGIHLWHDVHQVTVANNVAFDNATGGILIGGGDFVHTMGPADHITVFGNVVFGNADFGVIEEGITGHRNRFVCNLVYDNGTNWRLLTSHVQPCEAPGSADDTASDNTHINRLSVAGRPEHR